MKQLTKKYFWKEISSDGLLKEPEPSGPYYDEISLNTSSGFDTEEEAIVSLRKFGKDNIYLPDLTLITIYDLVNPTN